jgi:hypothetical protein
LEYDLDCAGQALIPVRWDSQFIVTLEAQNSRHLQTFHSGVSEVDEAIAGFFLTLKL